VTAFEADTCQADVMDNLHMLYTAPAELHEPWLQAECWPWPLDCHQFR
jgi:hypothetical protein